MWSVFQKKAVSAKVLAFGIHSGQYSVVGSYGSILFVICTEYMMNKSNMKKKSLYNYF